jgi:hypothetical protein
MSVSKNDNGVLPFVILVNDEAQLEYHRGKALSAQQRAYLERMDRQMDAGVPLGGVSIEKPDDLQRAQFVALQVLKGLQQGNEALIAAGCAYLARRLPDLTQVKARLVEGGFSVELVFNEPYVKEVAVELTPRRLS